MTQMRNEFQVACTSAPASVAVEQREVEILSAHLERTPRLQKLLLYLTEKYFDGTADQVTEYKIATEVFDRKETIFIASEDSIARVQTHRLRKALKEFYENDGREHAVIVSIPLGSYVPLFSHQLSVSTASADEDAVTTGPNPYTVAPQESSASDELNAIGTVQAQKTQHIAGAVPRVAADQSQQLLRLGAAAACLMALLFVVFYGWRVHQRAQHFAGEQSTLLAAFSQGSASPNTPHSPSVPIPFRMIAGYSGPAQRDSSGDLWQPDQYVTNGWPLHQPTRFIAATSDPFLFQYGRAGDFSYDIPLQPGLYELHLYFFEPSVTVQSEDAEDKVVFNVTLNNSDIILFNFDPISDANGRNIAAERVFRDISPAQDGKLHLHFSSVNGTPSVRAIELLKGTPHKQLPIRIVTQATAYTDASGNFWHPDTYFIGGRTLTHELPQPDLLNGRQPPTERYGHFSYAIPVDTRDRYTVILHFVEFFWGTDEPGQLKNGSRIFRVMCNGSTLIDNFNIYKEAGDYHALTKTFSHLKPTAQGKLNLSFEPIENYATVSGIEVIDESN